MMSTLSSANYDYSKWEKVGDVYKQFSIYDTSKYESMSVCFDCFFIKK